MMNKTRLKKLNDLGKKLSSNGLYTIIDNKIVSTWCDKEKETPGVHYIEFINKKDNDVVSYKYILNKLNNPIEKDYIINGNKLSKVISGSGLNCEINEEKHSTIITSNIKVKDKKEKVEIKWENIESDSYFCNKIIKDYSKYLINMLTGYVVKNYEIIDEELEDLLLKKKFIIDLSKQLSVNLMLITNKLIKNFNKDTKNITIEVIKNDNLDNLKLCHIMVKDDVTITHSIYAFID